MADEIKNENDVPEEVEVNGPVSTEEATDENEQVKGKLAEFGQDNLEAFLVKMTSDAIFARKVTRSLLGLKNDQPIIFSTTSGARQEHNITGTLSHTEFPPKVMNPTPDASKDGITDAPVAA